MHADTCVGSNDIGNIRLVEPRHTINDGAVQICNQFTHISNASLIAWCYLNSTESWNTTAARVACRQLGLQNSGTIACMYTHACRLILNCYSAAPTILMITLQRLVLKNIVIRPVTCSRTEDQLRDCLRDQYNITINTDSAIVAGLSCSTLILMQ